MKTTRHIRHLLATGLLTLALTPALATAQPYGMHMDEWGAGGMMQRGTMMGGCPGMPGMMGPGMGMMGPGMGYGMGYGMNLTPEQQTEMRRIQRETRRQHWENMGRLMEAHEELQELLAAEQPDPAAVGRAHARIAELKRPMIEARVRAMNEMRSLLTDEQRERMRSGRWGPGMMDDTGGGMGPGMRGGMMGR